MLNYLNLSKFILSVFFTMSTILSNNAQTDQPNIIFILVDDLGYGDLGVFFQDDKSGNKFDTPYLDNMAAEGMRMVNHYTVPVCAPSRSSLLQGLSPGHASVRNNQFDVAIPIDLNMPKVLQLAGYKTYMVGKHGVAGYKRDDFPSHPLNNGFDDYFGYLNHVAGHEHYPRNGTTDKEAFIYEGKTRITTGTEKTYTTDVFTARAKKDIIDHVQNDPNQPFFLYLAYDAPHSKLQIPTMAYPEGKGVNGGLQWTGPDNTETPYVNTATGTIDSWHYPDVANQDWPDYAKKHVTMIRRLDEAIGDIIVTLQDLNIDDDTLIVFTSDNGPHRSRGQNPDFFESYGNLRGIKRDITDGGIRVPVIARWPSTIEPNTISTHNCGMWNWGATFADIANSPIPARMDGASLLPVLKGNIISNDLPPYVEYFNNSRQRREMQAIRMGDFIGIRTNTSSSDTPLEIYNLVEDSKQINDLAETLPTLEAKMKRQMLRMRIAHSSQDRPYDNDAIPAVPVNVTNDGLNYTTVRGAFDYIPRVEEMIADTRGQVNNVNLSIRPASEDFSVLYEGFLNVPTEGAYTFYLNSEAPSHFMLHDIHVLGSDLTHSTGEISQTLQLEEGYHPIKLYYTHGNEANFNLELSYEGPGISKQEIPNNAFVIGQRLSEDPSQTYVIEHKSSGGTLYANDSGSNLETTDHVNDLNYWVQEDAGNGFFYLVHKESGRKLHSNGDFVTVNTVRARNRGDNVQWRLEEISNDNWYRLQHKASGKWLHVKQDGTSFFQLIDTNNTGNNTRWRITPQGAPEDINSKKAKQQISSSFMIYPNPIASNGTLSINIPNKYLNATLSVVDITGNIIKQEKASKNTISLDLNNVAKGVYFIKIGNDELTETKKILIK